MDSIFEIIFPEIALWTRTWLITGIYKYPPGFMKLFNLESVINNPTCFQSEKRRCIDSVIKNKKVFPPKL